FPRLRSRHIDWNIVLAWSSMGVVTGGRPRPSLGDRRAAAHGSRIPARCSESSPAKPFGWGCRVRTAVLLQLHRNWPHRGDLSSPSDRDASDCCSLLSMVETA